VSVQHAVTSRLSRILHLPPPTTEVDVDRELRVPMRDGVNLIADHYAPRSGAPLGTLLVRGPYGRGWPFAALYARAFAARGYHVLLQSVRGTFGSGGEFEPFVSEVADGHDTAAWLRDQTWFTGTFGTVGLSYLGWTQWALLTDPPPELKAAVITVGPHDVSGPRWGANSFGISDFLGWSYAVEHQEKRGRVGALLRARRTERDVLAATLGLSLGESSRALLGDGATWFDAWLDHPDVDDPFWADLRLPAALERADVPVLLLSGWQDLFLEQTLEQYAALRRRGVATGLTVGPWTHGQMMSAGGPTGIRESLDWLGTHLAGTEPARRAPVRIHLSGHGWLELPDWPPAMDEHVLHPHPGRRLGDAPPEPDAVTFVYNPADPTPTIGGRLLAATGGYRDDSALALRADVLTFTGEPLPADLCVIGSPTFELAHRCANPHNDLFVRISQVDADGTSHNVSDGYLASAPDAGDVRITLDAVAHTFPAGARIRLMIAGGSHPRFVRNSGSGEKLSTGRTLATARHTIELGAATRLVLPAGPNPPSGD
jgi:uncharacterized protein